MCGENECVLHVCLLLTGDFGARISMFEILINKRLKATLNSGQYDRSNERYIVVNKKQENKKA